MWFGTPADHRGTHRLVLPACAILDGLQWSQSSEIAETGAHVRYGATGADLQVTHSDTTSVGSGGTTRWMCPLWPLGRRIVDRLALHIIARRAQLYRPCRAVPLDDLPLSTSTCSRTRKCRPGDPSASNRAPCPPPSPTAVRKLDGNIRRGHLDEWPRPRTGTAPPGQREWGVSPTTTRGRMNGTCRGLRRLWT